MEVIFMESSMQIYRKKATQWLLVWVVMRSLAPSSSPGQMKLKMVDEGEKAFGVLLSLNNLFLT